MTPLPAPFNSLSSKSKQEGTARGNKERVTEMKWAWDCREDTEPAVKVWLGSHRVTKHFQHLGWLLARWCKSQGSGGGARAPEVSETRRSMTGNKEWWERRLFRLGCNGNRGDSPYNFNRQKSRCDWTVCFHKNGLFQDHLWFGGWLLNKVKLSRIFNHFFKSTNTVVMSGPV